MKYVSNNLSGMTHPRSAWVKLNRLRTGVGLFRATMHKWGMAPIPTRECGAKEQSGDHIITSCPIHYPPHGALEYCTQISWLNEKCPTSDDILNTSTPHEEPKIYQNTKRIFIQEIYLYIDNAIVCKQSAISVA